MEFKGKHKKKPHSGLSARGAQLYAAVQARGNAGLPEALNFIASLTNNDVADIAAIARLPRQELEPERAAALYKKWCDLDSGNPGAYAHLGQALLSMENFTQAHDALQMAVVLDPENFDYGLALFWVVAAQEKWQHAEMIMAGLRHKYPQHATYLDEAARQLAGQRAASSGGSGALHEHIRPIKVLLCCLPGLDNFVDDIIKGLTPGIEVVKCVSKDMAHMLSQIALNDIIWLEWGNSLAELLTNKYAELLRNKKVILRIHSYEVYDNLDMRINYQVIDELIFVARHIYDFFRRKTAGPMAPAAQANIIPNGVAVDNYNIAADKKTGNKIAYLGYINFKKDPMVFLHAFAALLKHEPRFELYLAGKYQDIRTPIAMDHFIQSNKLQHKIFFQGWQTDINKWFEDKDYIIQSSLAEAHPVGVMEAMACGLKPAIYNFPGAENIFAREFLWNNIDEFIALFRQPLMPMEYRRFVEEKYSLARQVEQWRQVIYGLA